MADITWGVKNGDVAAIEKVLKESNPKIDDEALCNGRPAIVSAADYGQTEVVTFLLDNGANVNAKDKHGITPLLAAIWENHTATVRILLARGADKTQKSISGKSYCDETDNKEVKALLQ